MRQTTLFNSDWKFLKGDAAGAYAPGFKDDGWRTLTLPHDWSIEGPFDERWASATGFLPGGIGWYRKTFALPEGYAGQQVFIHFDGVYCNSEVWINGHSLGRRPNGFVLFRYDLTPYLNAAGPNTLAVKVDHSHYGDARWYTGSGINRNVFLIGTKAVHLKHWGVFAAMPVVLPDYAEVLVTAEVQNQSAGDAEVQVECALHDPQGQVAAQTVTPVSEAPGGEQAAHSRLAVLNPQLWSVDQPHLYTLRTVLRRDGQVIDQEETSVGLRSIRFDANDGFFLNGQNLKMKGVCLHDDAGALGTAVPVKVWERRLRTLKEAGVNAIRMAHNPHMPELYDLCDQLGFLVQDEAFDEWELGKNKWLAGWNVGAPGKDGPHDHFAEWGEADLRDMVLRDRNHPSVIMWSIGNEIDYPNDPYSHEVLNTGTNPQSYGRGYQPKYPHANRLGEIARRLASVVKPLDSTRPVTAGLAAALISNEVGFADALDVAGYNYQEYRYADDHAKYPNRVLYGSENGMRWDFWEAVAANPYVCGQFLWTGIDYLGEAGRWPARSNGAGLLDLAGFPKPEYYYRQSLWSEMPMAYLGTRDVPKGDEASSLWDHRQAEPVWNGTKGVPRRVVCFTNCEEAELSLNGQSLGIKCLADAPDHALWWDVPYVPGTLTVMGLSSGARVCSAELTTSGPAKKLRAEVDTPLLTADGADLAHVAVTIVDENGVLVYDATPEVSWEITGPARLLGLESGDHASHEDYQANTRRAFHGRLLGYVQATETSGSVTIRLTAPGLEEATILRM